MQWWFCGSRGAGAESGVGVRSDRGGVCALRRSHVDLAGVGLCAVVLVFGVFGWFIFQECK